MKDYFEERVMNITNYIIENIATVRWTAKKLGIGRHQKNMKDIFYILMKRGSPKLAIRYAKRTIKEGKGRMPTDIAPGTKVYELVEELAKYLPEKIKERL